MLLLDVSTFCKDTAPIWGVVGSVVVILQIAVPIIIVLLGTIDLGKAVMAGKDDEIKSAQKMFVKRIIYGVAVFFVVWVVRAVFNLVGNRVDEGDSAICWTCVSSPKSCPKN